MGDAGFNIRALEISDAGLIATLHAAALVDGSDESPWNRTAMDRVLQMPGAFGFLVSAPTAGMATPVGFVLACTTADEPEILVLAVLPLHRRRGVGDRLLRRVIDQAKDNGARRLFLEVAEDNSAAQKLYLDVGFTKVGRRPNYYRRSPNHSVDALLLKYTL